MTNEELLKRIERIAKGKATRLDLRGNQLRELPPELWSLTNLKRLYLNHNLLGELPSEIGSLMNLRTLHLTDNQLNHLPSEIGLLTNLRVLALDFNKLDQLPDEIGQLEHLQHLLIQGNPLKNMPPEIISLGDYAILRYLREQWKNGVPEWVSKMLVVGEGGVGKTCLLRALRGEPFDPHEGTTHGIDISLLELAHPSEAGVVMRLNAWDFGGQEIYHATHQFFLTNRSLFLLAWNARHGFEQGKLYYWLDTIQAKAPESPVLIVATHIDQRDADIPLEELQDRYPQIIGHCEISNLTGQGVNTLRQEVAIAAANLPLMGEIWPTNWRAAAYALRSHEENHITPKQMHELMVGYNVRNDSTNTLAGWLHELGDILYYQDDDELNDMVILKPQWVTERISQVLESEEVIGRLGIFTRAHMDTLWADLDPFIRSHFLRLMEKFDLSYRTLENREISLVVERLPLDPPSYQEKWDAISEIDACNEIAMKFELNTIPAGIPTWFIARAHRFTTHTHWRTGALFGDDRNAPRRLALAQAFPHDRYLLLTVRGPHPQNFFALLRDGLELTLARFPGLRIDRMIPCPGHNGRACSHEFAYEQLLKRLERTPPREMIECPEALEDVSVLELLFGLHLTTQDRVLSRIDELDAANATRQQEVLTELQDLRALTQRGFTAAFGREQRLAESHCPNVFVLRPSGAKTWWNRIVGQKLDLQLYCQAPGFWHPTEDGGFYEIDEPAGWLQAVAPYLGKMASIFKHVAPLVGPWIGMASREFEELVKHDIKLMEELVKKLPDIERASDRPLDETLLPERFEGAPLRALRTLLDEVDPQRHWGGLKKVLTPEGHYLWLCEYHAREYTL